MNEVLEKILSSELLTEEVKAELATTLETVISEQVDTRVAEKTEELVVEYAARYAQDREALVEALDTKVEEMLQEQLSELADDIAAFRDLEVEYEVKLAEAKVALAEDVEKDMQELVERLDTFLELRLTEEMTELQESIEEVRKNNLGRKIFEAFKSEIEQYTNADNGAAELESKLSEAEARLAAVDQQLNEARKELAEAARKDKLEQVLSTLHGRPREIMEAILTAVPTEKLEESFEKFIGRVLHESAQNSEKESAEPAVEAPVLAEGETVVPESVVEDSVVVITGNDVEEVGNTAKTELSESAKQMLRLAGVTV